MYRGNIYKEWCNDEECVMRETSKQTCALLQCSIKNEYLDSCQIKGIVLYSPVNKLLELV